MFKRLQRHWKVNTTQLFLILCTFAITGTTTAYISRAITRWVGFNEQTWWLYKALLRASVLIFGYQFIILIVAFFFGQFSFFWNYEKKILRRLGFRFGGPEEKAPLKVAVFASGAGSNAQQIINHFKENKAVDIALVACNKPGAGVLDIAAREGIQVLMLEKERFFSGDGYLPDLQKDKIDFIVLAGFLWQVPVKVIQAFPQKIVNIHPALLPRFGGKGMYGRHVHEAVLAAGETESGITIHYVDELYDHGPAIFQATCPVSPDDTPDTLAQKIHQLEHSHFPPVLEKILIPKA